MLIPTDSDPDVILLTDSRYENPSEPDWYVENILLEDRLLSDALAVRGLRCARVDWNRQDVDWTRARCAVFRTTWDYFDRIEAFRAWLQDATSQLPLINSASLVRWNLDKHYLCDLEAAGVAIVPTRIVEPGFEGSLRSLAEEAGFADVVVKPAVGGGGRHTRWVRQGEFAQHEAWFAQLVQQEALLVQPFQPSVLERGEVTLVMLGGTFSHAVRKVAKPGDFRVQDDYGGTVHPYAPTRVEVELAERAMAAAPERPLYGRVDMVRGTDERPCVMELEVIEPELWIRERPSSAERMADCIVRSLA